ncbi:MAG: hypothetical protein QNJ63_22345 [Calothrix sp. MO_192.B10]|nr:hypothetical protein [Calothrix sp. MO_192.B10]
MDAVFGIPQQTTGKRARRVQYSCIYQQIVDAVFGIPQQTTGKRARRVQYSCIYQQIVDAVPLLKWLFPGVSHDFTGATLTM